METLIEEPPEGIGHYARKITRHELAAKQGISLRYVDELTRNGVLPHYKIGRSVRYNLAECEAVMRQRFYVRAKARYTDGKSTSLPG